MFRLSGKCSQKTFSVFVLGCIVAVSALSLLTSSFVASGAFDVDDSAAVKDCIYVFFLILIILMSVKRLRDAGKSP